MDDTIFIKVTDLTAELNKHFYNNDVIDCFIEDYLGDDLPDYLDRDAVIDDIKRVMYPGNATMTYVADCIIPGLPTYKIVKVEDKTTPKA